MTIRCLEIYVELCKYMNMSKTAQMMMISQSSVSQAISALEKEYNVILFERLNHNLYLTEAGKEMLFLSQQVLKNIEYLNAKMNDSAFQSKLKVGACSSISYFLIHPLINYLKDNKLNADITVEMSNSQDLEEKLLNAQLDLAFIQRAHISPYLSYLPILKDELVIICWKGHPLAKKTVQLHDLQNEVFIRRENGSGTEVILENAFLEHGISLKTGWICNSIDLIIKAVKYRRGIALVSRFLIDKMEDIEVISISDHKFIRNFDLVYHKDKIHNNCFQNFIDLCEDLGYQGMEKLILENK